MKNSTKQPIKRQFIQVHNDDNVVVAIQPFSKGEVFEHNSRKIELLDDVPAGHKVCIKAIAAGEDVIKYGYSIGQATCDIRVGHHVHSLNLKTKLDGSERYHYNNQVAAPSIADKVPSFMGYQRNNGLVGIRNEIWIINTVGCVNQAAKRITDICKQKYAGQADDFIAITHPYGCSQLGDDLSNTKNLLASLIQHPNAGGIVVVGLGCENNQLSKLIGDITGLDESRIRYYNSQEVTDEIETGVECVEALLQQMASDQRTQQPVSKLSLGMKCGGSDGFSGLTANSIVGRVTDKLTQFGGRVILTETPEMFGAEQVLMDRAQSEEIFNQTVKLVSDFKQYFIDNNQPIYENPSPGNKAGGLTTLEEKSLGAIQKGGKAIINEVIDYGGKASVNAGLTLLQAPGNDAVSSTALAAAGANIILFTTGRGTPLGFPVPTVKISSNSGLAERKPHWIDFNAGQILDSDMSVDECADKLFDYILQVASGAKTNNEKNDNREVAIWKNGVTL
ncbi:altronate hydrolase [Catenovulum agarivorans DS-2]|uniref:Altronate hydrolase n=1 Tax=Catenovulum agarivorans DS-2 TaxID=1328313 RepID=W7QJ62_9ALTE|nr:altronate dehydratase family protein [Catenovulum agarivorans]EWH08967.1 altronate hydrolase [Catenovulum agarivorans DS-2]